MKTSDFSYNLPQKYIAQTPIEPRDSSKLMVIDRISGRIIEHTIFNQINRFLNPGDLLVLNETRVIPARIFGRKIPSGGKVEILFLKEVSLQVWECLVGGKGLLPGKKIQLEDLSSAEIIKNLGSSRRLIQFENPPLAILKEYGQMPLPPYIHETLYDPERYQTVYSKQLGSAAAPTAGLHFTKELLNNLQNEGVNLTSVVLHVGLDTFSPVKEDDPTEHKIHTEWCLLSDSTARMINETKNTGGRIFAVGTTSVRVVETAAVGIMNNNKLVMSFSGNTDLFILPGYKFKVVDGLITNFHLPNSTLIMLVSAFLGRENVLKVYETAKQENYRFYSFGDAMLIL